MNFSPKGFSVASQLFSVGPRCSSTEEVSGNFLSKKIQMQTVLPTEWQFLEFDKISLLQAGLFELLYHLSSGVHRRAGSLKCNFTNNKTNKRDRYDMKRQGFQPSLFRKLTFHRGLRYTLQVVLGKWCFRLFVIILLWEKSKNGISQWGRVVREGRVEGWKSWLHFWFLVCIFHFS